MNNTDKTTWFPHIMSELRLNSDTLFNKLPMGALADIELKLQADAGEVRGLHIEQLAIQFKDENTENVIESYFDILACDNIVWDRNLLLIHICDEYAQYSSFALAGIIDLNVSYWESLLYLTLKRLCDTDTIKASDDNIVSNRREFNAYVRNNALQNLNNLFKYLYVSTIQTNNIELTNCRII